MNTLTKLGIAAAALLGFSPLVGMAAEIIYQPDGSSVADTYIYSQYQDVNNNHGDAAGMHNWDNSWGGDSHSMLNFDLSGLPAAANVSSVQLVVHLQVAGSYGWNAQVPVPVHYDMYQITSPWDEMTVTYNSRPSWDGTMVSSAEVSFDPVNPTTSGSYIFFDDYISYDITALYAGWKSGAMDNYGILIDRREQGGDNAEHHYIASSDNLDEALRPYLVLTGDFATGSVPAPHSMALLALGLMGLSARLRYARN